MKGTSETREEEVEFSSGRKDFSRSNTTLDPLTPFTSNIPLPSIHSQPSDLPTIKSGPSIQKTTSHGQLPSTQLPTLSHAPTTLNISDPLSNTRVLTRPVRIHPLIQPLVAHHVAGQTLRTRFSSTRGVLIARKNWGPAKFQERLRHQSG
jgi:hypothetical protein